MYFHWVGYRSPLYASGCFWIAIQRRIFEVPVEGDVFQRLQQEAQLSPESVPKIIDRILRERLAMTETGGETR